MQYQNIHNLVFEGGGVEAIAYAGFIDTAIKEGILSLDRIERVAGVSSGAIAAMQIALNYSPTDMLDIVRQTDFSRFAETGGMISEVLRFFTKEGVYKQEFLYKYLCDLIKAKTGDENITFHGLQLMKEKKYFKDLYVIVTKLFILNNQPVAQPITFSHEHTPFARIVDVIRASASLPIVFPPMRLIKDKNDHYIIHSKGDIYVDGGIIETYPIRLFDHPRYLSTITPATRSYNQETLGLRFESFTQLEILGEKKKNKEHIIKNALQYAEALFYILRKGQQENDFATSTDRSRSILINSLNIASTQFDLTKQQKEELLASGKKSALQMIKIKVV